jgi:predicted protein tyrosine phosphatase
MDVQSLALLACHGCHAILAQSIWPRSKSNGLESIFTMNIKAARVDGLEVSVCGAHELPQYVERRMTHVVSIWDGHEADNEERRSYIQAVFPNALTHFAFFHDLLSNPTARYAPTMGAVKSILQFTAAVEPPARLLVHCAMGISRSTAIALATLCDHAGPGYEVECFAALKRLRPSACPNPLIVHFADDVLGRTGAIIESLGHRCWHRWSKRLKFHRPHSVLHSLPPSSRLPKTAGNVLKYNS